MKELVFELMIKEWRKKGMSDSRWMQLAKRIAKKTGSTIDEIFYEWNRQFELELGN